MHRLCQRLPSYMVPRRASWLHNSRPLHHAALSHTSSPSHAHASSASTTESAPAEAALSSLLEKSTAVWQQWRDDLQSRLGVIDRKLSETQENTQEYKELQQQKQQLLKAVEDKTNSLEKYHAYTQGQSENADMPLFHQMDNHMFRKHQGPQLMMRMANYYHLGGDVVPSSWLDQVEGAERLLNWVVEFTGGDDSMKAEDRMPLDDAKKRKAWMEERMGRLVARGNVLTAEQTRERPQVHLRLADGEADKLFSIVLIDADTPNPRNQSMIACPLWWTANVPVTTRGMQLEKGISIVDYVPPHPQQGTGFHRYVWLALEQKENMDKDALLLTLNQCGWNTSESLKQQSDLFTLRGLCFHRAGWTKAVSDLYASGAIQYPKMIAESFAYVPEDVQGSQEQLPLVTLEQEVKTLTVEHEPVFGCVAERSWQSVVRRLPKYQFL